MARVNRFLLTLASGSALYSGMVPALGLGEITLHSALNQPLEAEIELLEIGDLNSDEVLVNLASAAAFERSGVERFVFLHDLRFTPVLRGGRGVIRVVSSQPVREPYLNFLVEVSRPGGTLLREYTLLIDPPGSSAYMPVASPLQTQPRPQPQVLPAATESPVPRRPSRPPVAPPPAQLGERYTVARGDSLWLIAQRLRAAGSQAPEQALMEGIHALNPQAFIGGDIDRLKLGAQLLLPDAAVSEVIARGASDLPEPAVATEVETVGAAPAEALPQAEADATAVAEGERIAALQRQVDAQLAVQTAESRQLREQLSGLQRQMESLQQQLAERDRLIADLQAELASRASVPAAPQVADERPAHAVSGSGLVVGGLLLLLLAGGLMLRNRLKSRQLKVVRGVPEPVTAEAPRPFPEPVRTPLAHDPLEGADIYIAYGRHDEAANTLRSAIRQAPERLDLQLRLLEVLGELRDVDGFAEQESVLQGLGAGEQTRDIRARYAERLMPQEDPLQDVVLALDDEAPAATDKGDVQLNLDNLSLDADWDEVSPFQVAVPRSKPTLVTSDPAFRSNLNELPEVSELSVDRDALSPFGDPPQVEVGLDELSDEFLGTGEVGTRLDQDLQHLAGNREHLTMLNMALAYIEQGHLDAACNVLNELISAGDDQEKQVARKLLARIA